MSVYHFAMHTKKQVTEKHSDPDKHAAYKITLTTAKDNAKIGFENANLTLTIKAESDQALQDFPRHGVFQLTIKQLNPNNQEESKTVPTTMEIYTDGEP
ncbi:MAG: hypothetical protein FWC74_02920 [Candidatus Bathyarchaeota archaeon]|nr:hypothetical protein [Candidatus Termitimicrobium sp.]